MGSNLSMRRPLRTLVIAGCCIAALAVAGLGAESKLHQTSLSVSGTESARTGELLRHYFGESEPFIILLQGPPEDVAVQGQRLVQDLERNPLATTISPWSREPVGELKPTARSAVIFVSFRVGLDEAVKRIVPYLNGLLRRRISAPVHAVQSGYASVSSAIQDEAAKATARGELIAVPLVLLVLLLVFRSPIAALIPLAFGGATVVASRGILSIAANWLSIDAFALTVSAMMGLALGVDYTLLMVSRFREELAAGNSPVAAARSTRRTAGRTIAFAGGALFLSMVASALLLPGTFLVSLAGAVVVVAGFSVVLGIVVVPPLLAVVGTRIDRWSLRGTGRTRRGALDLVDPFLRRPGAAVALITVSLILLALPVISLRVGPPNPDQLSSTNRARLNAELVNREIGPGWAAPYVILAATSRGAITSRSNLEALRRWERSIARISSVDAVVGPGAIGHRIEPVTKIGRGLLAQGRPGSEAMELQRLGSHLGRAAEGVTRLRSGIAQATYGAGLLSDGSQNVERGAQAIESGLHVAAVGSSRAADAVNRFAAGAHEIRTGQHRASLGALALKYDIQDLIPRLRHSTLSPSRRLQRELREMKEAIPNLESRTTEAEAQLSLVLVELAQVPTPPGDPHLLGAVSAAQAAGHALTGEAAPTSTVPSKSVSAELQSLGTELIRANGRATEITAGALGRVGDLREATPLVKRLVHGLTRLEQGGKRLDTGAHRLANSASALADGLQSGLDGSTALSGGAQQLALGTSSLAGNLSQAYSLSRPLEPGLTRAAKESATGGESLRRQSERLLKLTPGLFDSGYFNLSVLDGTPPGLRSRVEQEVNVTGGGQAARILVIPKHEGSTGLDEHLRVAARRLGDRVVGPSGVSGGPAELNDYSQASRSRLPLVIAVVSLVTFLSLVIVLRAVVVAAATVLLNLLSVAVAFGVLALIAGLPSGSPLGDWSYIDTIGAVAIFAIAFGVSIDYSVFILVRMREEFDRTGDHALAVRVGVHRTGRVITGAALMMVAVFAAFATSSLAIVSQLGTGLTVAILLDATVIRLVLLPALLLLIGERSWWLPKPLDRRLTASRLT